MPSISILGFDLALDDRYRAGQSITASEAGILNRSLARGIGKGLHRVLAGAIKVRGGKVAGELDDLGREECRSLAREFIEQHSLGFSQGFEKLRAIEVEARRIALGALESGLYRQGKRLTDISEGEREGKLDELILSPAIRKEAEKRVESTTRIANMAHEELLASLGGGQDV